RGVRPLAPLDVPVLFGPLPPGEVPAGLHELRLGRERRHHPAERLEPPRLRLTLRVAGSVRPGAVLGLGARGHRRGSRGRSPLRAPPRLRARIPPLLRPSTHGPLLWSARALACNPSTLSICHIYLAKGCFAHHGLRLGLPEDSAYAAVATGKPPNT